MEESARTYVFKAIGKVAAPACWILCPRKILIHEYEDAWLFETNMYKQMVYLQGPLWVAGTSGKLKQEMQLLTEHNGLGNKANLVTVSSLPLCNWNFIAVIQWHLPLE